MNDDVRFVQRIRRLRACGLGAGFVCVAAVFYENHEGPLPWILSIFDTLVCPLIAYGWAIRHKRPRWAETINLMIDSASGGLWVALTRFNLLPSVLVISMLTADKLNVGGWRLMLRALPGQVLTCLFVAALNGFKFSPHTSQLEILACLPFLLLYPSAISLAAHGLARRVVQQNIMLRDIGRTDVLTGLASRSYWSELAYSELMTARSRGHASAILMLDIDHFKSINDRGGHAAGDQVLRQFARLLREAVRGMDVTARFAGDEFVVLMPEATADIARQIAERIRSRASAIKSSGVPCSVSVGIAALDDGMSSAETWLDAADQALYEAKSEGRDRVKVFGQGPGLAEIQGELVI